MKSEDKTLTAIANLDRLKVLQLMNETHKPFTFTDIQKALKLKKGSVTFHVKSLLKAGLISNIYERKVESTLGSTPTTHSLRTVASRWTCTSNFNSRRRPLYNSSRLQFALFIHHNSQSSATGEQR
jgi:predicted transcriptional regulator